jgi:hypothetical protein
LADAGPLDAIWFEDSKRDKVATYLQSEGKAYRSALDATARLIEGFQSPLGMELLATVDWLIDNEGVEASVEAIKSALEKWPGGAGSRKLKLFEDRMISIALERLATLPAQVAAQ